MKRALIIPNLNNDKDHIVTSRVVEKLTSLGITSFIDEEVAVVDGATPYHDSLPVTDMVVVIGGDGSVIDASKYAIEKDIPLLGINLGKVGYLTEVEPDGLSILDITTSFTASRSIALPHFSVWRSIFSSIL